MANDDSKNEVEHKKNNCQDFLNSLLDEKSEFAFPDSMLTDPLPKTKSTQRDIDTEQILNCLEESKEESEQIQELPRA